MRQASVHVGQSGTSTRMLHVFAQPVCVTLSERDSDRGYDLNAKQARDLADALLKTVDVVEGVAVLSETTSTVTPELPEPRPPRTTTPVNLKAR
jgi:hypothetical protein